MNTATDMSEVREHSTVFAKDGEEVGTVDHLDGKDYIKLTRSGSADGRHHWIPTSMVERADQSGVYIRCSSEDFQSEALSENPNAQRAS